MPEDGLENEPPIPAPWLPVSIEERVDRWRFCALNSVEDIGAERFEGEHSEGGEANRLRVTQQAGWPEQFRRRFQDYWEQGFGSNILKRHSPENFGIPKLQPDFYTDTMALSAALAEMNAAGVSPSPLMQVYEYVRAWFTEYDAFSIPSQNKLEGILEQALIVLAVLETANRETPAETKSIDMLERETPPLNMDDGSWVNAETAHQIEDLGIDTLKSYRFRGESTPDKNFGRDRYGRVWRRPPKTSGSHPWYLRSSLKDSPKKA